MTPPRAAPPPDGTVTLDVSLLGRSYKVACNEDERAELMAAVSLLEGRLQEIRAGGKITGTERIAVMAALNLAHELLRERAAPAASGASTIQPLHAQARRVLLGRRLLVGEFKGGEQVRLGQRIGGQRLLRRVHELRARARYHPLLREQVADLAYLYLQLTPIRLAGIVDEREKRRSFFGHEIAGLEGTRQAGWDMILVTRPDHM